MLIQLLFLIILLFLLFFLTRRISSTIYNCIYLITLNQTFAIGVLTFILLPGTIIHELSHFLAATLVRVQTGELSILPEIEKNGEVKAGKLMLGASDPFRHSLIGLAPMIIGLALIYITGKIFLPDFPQLPITNYQLIVFGLYLLFIVSITMFSSRKDIESLVISVPILILIFISLYTVGVRIFLNVNFIRKMDLFLSDINRFLFIAALTDYIIYVLLTCNNTLIEKILRRKIVYQ